MSDSEALGYYLAAPPDVGASDLRHYAENGSDDLARRAIEVLSSDTSQQFYVRETILTNLEADKERRIVALAGLAKYDKAFASYATLPPVIDLALVADQVPGAEGMSGTDLISRAVQLNIQANPGLRDFYTRRIEESSEAFRDVPAAMEEIQRSLIAPLRDG